MRKTFVVLGFILLGISACQTTQPQDHVSPSVEAKEPLTPIVAPAPTPAPAPAAETVQPKPATVATGDQAALAEKLPYDDTWTFDWELSQKLRGASAGVDLETAGEQTVTLNEIPERLDRWLSRIKEHGGRVKAAPIPKEGGMQTRALFGVLLDVVLYLVGIAKDEATYSAADNYDAILHYDPDTGEIKKVSFVAR